MGEHTLRNTFIGAVNEVFEKMYYIFLEIKDPGKLDHCKTMAVSFAGSATGMITGRLNTSLIDQMIFNALGVKMEDITEGLREDCVKECMNMTCGAFLQRFNPDTHFTMSLPFCPPERKPDTGRGESGISLRVAFEADGDAEMDMELFIKIP